MKRDASNQSVFLLSGCPSCATGARILPCLTRVFRDIGSLCAAWTRQLRFSAQIADVCVQFVRQVRGELGKPHERFLQPIKHSIEGLRQRTGSRGHWPTSSRSSTWLAVTRSPAQVIRAIGRMLWCCEDAYSD